MPQFNNWDELIKWAESSTGKKVINNTIMNDVEARRTLKQASGLLEEILRKNVESYYESYSPVRYQRTYDFLYSIKVSDVQQIGNELSISVYFDPNMATHPSIFNGEDGFVPILLDQGWKWKRDEEVNINHLSHYEGFHFIDKSIDEFNKVNRWGFRISKEGKYKGESIF